MSGSNVSYIPRLKKKYNQEIIPLFMEKHGCKNLFEVPRLKKIVINRGVGQGSKDIKLLEAAQQELGVITGQKAVITRAKKSVSNFKIRKGDPVGCRVTLRSTIMYEFLDRLLNVALPRIKDFRGVSVSAFDNSGNYTLGLKEQIVFPEIEYDKVQSINGMDITIQIESSSVELSREFLKAMGMPFTKK